MDKQNDTYEKWVAKWKSFTNQRNPKIKDDTHEEWVAKWKAQIVPKTSREDEIGDDSICVFL